MTDIRLEDFPDKLRQLHAALDAGLAKRLKKATVMVNTYAENNLGGSNGAAPCTYPVPARTGNLRRSQQFKLVDPTFSMVFNTAAYAGAIHEGYVSRWAGRGKHVMASHARRPFMHDAVDKAAPDMVIANEISGVVSAWA